MLSVATTDGLALFDPAAIKRSSPSPTATLSLTSTTNAAVWSADNTRLFIASGDDIRTHQPGSSRAEVLYSNPTTISNIIVQNKKSLIFTAGEQIYVLDYDGKASLSTPKTLASMKSPINSLSLSSDSSLLSVTTLDAAHVYETATGSHTALRGSALIGLQIHTSAFHRETRTKLLLGANRQLLVYDTTKPLGPIRTIQINDPTSGDIIGITCSPFSKNLVAFCTAKGYVGLVDLEKDKGLFKTLNLEQPLTSITFSAEGASLYAGTDDGKILVVDLRGLDKPPREIIANAEGSRVVALSVQPKLKDTAHSSKPTASTASSVSKAPIRRLSGQSATTSISASISRAPAKISPPKPAAKAPASTPPKTPVPPKSKVPPSRLRNALNDSTSSEEKSSGKEGSKAKADSPPSTSSSSSGAGTAKTSRAKPTQSTSPLSSISTARTRTTLMTSRARGKNGSTDPAPSISVKSIAAATPPDPPPPEPAAGRPRTLSSASRSGADVALGRSARPASSTAPSRASASGHSSRASRTNAASPVPPVPPIPPEVLVKAPGTSAPAATKVAAEEVPREGTPLPELDEDDLPPPPMAVLGSKTNAAPVLGLDGDEVAEWIAGGKAKDASKEKDAAAKRAARRATKGVKSVGFVDQDDEESDDSQNSDDDEDKENHDASLLLKSQKNKGKERLMAEDDHLAVQISPRRQSNMGLGWAPSPLRNVMAGSSPGGTSAQELLRGMMRDIMFEFQEETRSEITGLHLDLVRTGRAWKKELRDIMQEYVGDLKELREENHRLREENEKLRRGY